MDKIIEEEIIEGVLSGDTKAYKQVVDAYKDNIFALIYKITTNREDSEELTQDVFVKAFFNLKSFKRESSFSTYLYRIAYNTTISKLRNKTKLFYRDNIEKSITAVDETENELLNKQIKEEQYEKLEMAIEQLGSGEKFLLLSFYQEDKSLNELADITGLSLSNIKIKMFRARKKLTNIIKDI